MQRIDILIFGASGFTGKHTIPQLAKFTKDTQTTWGVAGRSQQKLKSALETYKTSLGKPIDDIPIITADVTDETSLHEMARSAKLIINCCGPFLTYGEPVVKACIEQGTHYIDVTGEIQFIKEMREKYDISAREKGVYVISSCGVESIPADLGLVFLEKNFKGCLNSVDVYVEIKEEKGDCSEGAFNYATYASAISVFEKGLDFKEFFAKSDLEPQHSLKLLPHRVRFVDGWALPFPATDHDVIKASQNYFYKENGKRPVQAESYFVINSFLNLILFGLYIFAFVLLCQFTFGRKILLKYPRFFSNGYITHDDPNEERIERNRITYILYGQGWKENTDHTVKPDTEIIGKVKGKNMGYGTTCICLVLAALTILTEMHKMPKAGVISPGYAFAKTSLIKKLHNNGVTFEIV